MKPLSCLLLLAPLAAQLSVGQDFGARQREPAHPRGTAPAIDLPIPPGTYNVGSGEVFPTLDSAFHRLSGGGVLGPVTFLLTDSLYVASPANGGAFVLIGPIAGAGSSSRITVRPADGVAVTIRGDGEAVLFFQNVSYLTLDGIARDGPTRLRVHALYNTSGRRWNDAIDFVGDCDFNTIRDLTAWTDDVSRISAAVYMGGVSSGGPDSCIISGVSVLSGRFGIYLAGYPPAWLHRIRGNTIRNCHVGSPTDSLVSRGIQVEGTREALIEGNYVENLKLTLPDGSGTMRVHGICVHSGRDDTVRNNVVHTISATQTNAVVTGIFASGLPDSPGLRLLVFNNMVYDITTGAPQVVLLTGFLSGYQDSMRFCYNSISLAEGPDPLARALSAAAFFDEYNTVPWIANNLLLNTRDDYPSQSTAISLRTTAGTSDHNALFVPDAPGAFIARGPLTSYRLLSDWQATGNDLNSISILPPFRSPHLHIDSTNASSYLLEGHGTPLAGMLHDIDGQLRHPATPDIGADEFDLPVSVGQVGRGLPATSALGQNYPNPFNGETRIVYGVSPARTAWSGGGPGSGEWVTLKVYDILGREVAVLVDERQNPGSYSVSFPASGGSASGGDASNIPSGIYFYRLRSGALQATKAMMLIR